MSNIVMKEQWVNRSKGYRVGETDWYECYTDDEGELFRALQKDCGRCIGKVYVETDEDDSRPVGWVFLKKVKYDDVEEYYLQETWVSMEHRYKQ